MQLKQKLAYIALGITAVLAWQLLDRLITDTATAEHHEKASMTVKYVLSVDYPLGNKAGYLEWVKSVAPTLQAPDEVQRIVSYDNYYGSNPHRLIEMEFANMGDATKYFEREEIRAIMEDLPNHTSRADISIFMLRGDYSKN